MAQDPRAPTNPKGSTNVGAPVNEGDILAGKFRIDKVLGEGGMGVVVAATNIALEQKVAIKFLLPEAAQNEDIRARFGREARAAAKIQSQHVAKVIDVGELDSGAPYMVMEFLEGCDLSNLLEKQTQISYQDAARYVLEACEAIAEAHQAGIVHRDLKPANLFLANQKGGRTSIKVLDFGISKMVGPESASLTKTSALMGSPYYMSPEQMTSAKHVDARADIWALGVILYELVTGAIPFGGDTMPEIVASILRNQPISISELRPEVPKGFVEVVERCLRTSPADRFSSVASLAGALEPFSEGRAHGSVERISRVLGVPTVSLRPDKTTVDAFVPTLPPDPLKLALQSPNVDKADAQKNKDYQSTLGAVTSQRPAQLTSSGLSDPEHGTGKKKLNVGWIVAGVGVLSIAGAMGLKMGSKGPSNIQNDPIGSTAGANPTSLPTQAIATNVTIPATAPTIGASANTATEATTAASAALVEPKVDLKHPKKVDKKVETTQKPPENPATAPTTKPTATTKKNSLEMNPQ